MKIKANKAKESLINKAKEYIDRFKKIQKVIDKFPYFSNYIINNMITSEFGRIGDRYKEIYFKWHVYRGEFKGKNIANFKGDKEKKYTLSKIYINTLILYNRRDKYGLEKLSKYAFFFDTLNHTFFATDDELHILLEALNEWFIKASTQAYIDKRKDKIKKKRT